MQLKVKQFFSWVYRRFAGLLFWARNNPGHTLQFGLVLYYAIIAGSWPKALTELGDLAIQIALRM